MGLFLGLTASRVCPGGKRSDSEQCASAHVATLFAITPSSQWHDQDRVMNSPGRYASAEGDRSVSTGACGRYVSRLPADLALHEGEKMPKIVKGQYGMP